MERKIKAGVYDLYRLRLLNVTFCFSLLLVDSVNGLSCGFFLFVLHIAVYGFCFFFANMYKLQNVFCFHFALFADFTFIFCVCVRV